LSNKFKRQKLTATERRMLAEFDRLFREDDQKRIDKATNKKEKYKYKLMDEGRTRRGMLFTYPLNIYFDRDNKEMQYLEIVSYLLPLIDFDFRSVKRKKHTLFNYELELIVEVGTRDVILPVEGFLTKATLKSIEPALEEIFDDLFLAYKPYSRENYDRKFQSHEIFISDFRLRLHNV